MVRVQGGGPIRGANILTDIYISTDVDADGPIPGVYSMLSLGAAAFTLDKGLVGTFSVNLETLPDATAHEDTMDWWSTQPEAWSACREDLHHPLFAMKSYVAWVKNFSQKPVFVAYPVGFDFTFVYWYMIRFVGESPFRHSAIDIRSYAMGMLNKKEYRKSTKRYMPKRWFSADTPHTHKALDDAIEQGVLFCNMLTENVNLGVS